MTLAGIIMGIIIGALIGGALCTIAILMVIARRVTGEDRDAG